MRPRFVWGPGDTTLMPVMVEMVRSGRFRWIGGGHQLTSTTHVDNCVEGLVLAADRGAPGAAYFVTDGAPVAFREFVTALLATRGVEAPAGSVPRPLAAAGARAAEAAWRLLPLRGAPPLTRFAVWVASLECTLDDSRARAELGYEPVVTREDGLAALSARLSRSNRLVAVASSRCRTRAAVCLPKVTISVASRARRWNGFCSIACHSRRTAGASTVVRASPSRRTASRPSRSRQPAVR